MSIQKVSSKETEMRFKPSCTVFLLLIGGISSSYGNIYNADMENTAVCTRVLPIPVNPNDVYNIYAEPPQDGRGVRDKCTLKFYSTNGEPFKLFIRDLIFRECQIFIRLYDGDMFLNTARYSFNCESPPGHSIQTFSSEIALRLEKPDSTSTGYKFYIRLATRSGPDIGGEGVNIGDDTGMSVGMIVGIVIACVLVLAVLIAIILYALFIYRRKKEEKELELTRSRSILFGPSVRDSDSVHSSKHSFHSTHSTHFTKDTSQLSYPAFRTKPSISEKAPKCNSIDTKSFDSDTGDNTDNVLKPILVKDVRNEFNAMKKGLEREKRRKEQQEEDLRMQERRWKETRQADRKSREESNRGFNRSNKSRNDRVALNEENIRRSARADRHRSRSHHNDDNSNRNNHSGRSTHSTRSRERSRGHSPARSAGAWSEPDYISKHRESSRERERSNSASRRRSNSSGMQSRRKRDYYDDRDAYSDYDYDDRHRSHSRDRHNSYRSQRSGTQRSRSHSNTRHHR